jgi:hypothetical protein
MMVMLCAGAWRAWDLVVRDRMLSTACWGVSWATAELQTARAATTELRMEKRIVMEVSGRAGKVE